MNRRVWLSILLSISLLTGCSQPFGNFLEQTGSHEEGDTLGLTPDFSYDYEEQTPNILVNQIGYSPEGSKIAVLQGKNLETVFYVYNKDTGQIVYEGVLKETGVLEKSLEEEMEESLTEGTLYLADFSKLTTAGNYYVFQPDLGYSYTFEIQEKIYQELEQNLLTMIQEETRNTSQLCYQLAALLMAQELYGDYILEPERLAEVCEEKIQLLMQAQDTKSGSVYGEIPEAEEEQEISEQEHQQMVSLAATAEFAGVMAMYTHNMQSINRTTANQCQAAAEAAYRSIQTSLDNVSYDAGYFAATQLFRQTGKNKYAQAVGQYLAMQEEQKGYTEYDFTLFGDLAYLSSKYGVNLEWSEQVMSKVMKQAEQISLTSSRNNYYISQERDYYDVDGMLKDMSVMALVNYVITNHEYSTLLKNYRDYLLGRNPKAICLMDGFGTRNELEKEELKITEKNNALFYLLLQSTKI